jgi:hypothetical protein
MFKYRSVIPATPQGKAMSMKTVGCSIVFASVLILSGSAIGKPLSPDNVDDCNAVLRQLEGICSSDGASCQQVGRFLRSCDQRWGKAGSNSTTPSEPPAVIGPRPQEPEAAGFEDPELEKVVNFLLTRLDASCRSGDTAACKKRSKIKDEAEGAKYQAEECASGGENDRKRGLLLNYSNAACDLFQQDRNSLFYEACKILYPESDEGQPFSLRFKGVRCTDYSDGTLRTLAIPQSALMPQR